VPTPALTDLPSGLQGLGVKGVGCRVLEMGKQNASLICFNKDGLGTVHLIVVAREDIIDENLPAIAEVKIKDCYQCNFTGVDDSMPILTASTPMSLNTASICAATTSGETSSTAAT
ncbi:MAG: hypothetical protein AAF560_16905, partial [Acidobacteriota bacterium]